MCLENNVNKHHPILLPLAGNVDPQTCISWGKVNARFLLTC